MAIAEKQGTQMESTQINVYHNNKLVLLELDGAGLEISREEAEELFVRLGHTLQDMDVTEDEANVETHDRHTVGGES